MRRLALAAALLAAGCGEADDPEASRLKPGESAIVFDEKQDSLSVDVPGKPFIDTMVDVGTKVTVVSDATAAGGTSEGLRDVKVRVAEGEKSGLVGTISRSNLRPTPK